MLVSAETLSNNAREGCAHVDQEFMRMLRTLNLISITRCWQVSNPNIHEHIYIYLNMPSHPNSEHLRTRDEQCVLNLNIAKHILTRHHILNLNIPGHISTRNYILSLSTLSEIHKYQHVRSHILNLSIAEHIPKLPHILHVNILRHVTSNTS